MASKSDIDVAIDKVLTDFKISTLKAEQRTILDCLIEKKDCMAILPTGFGKSLPYQMLVSVRRELEKETSSDDVGKVIVCSPLVALMADQVDRINAVPNVTAAYRGACSNGDDDILKGKFDYLFASPETLISDKKWRMTLQQMNVSLIVVDEFHTICTWGGVGEQEEETAFRKWFRHIGELRSMFTTANLLALSATCTTTMRKRVMRELHMHKDLTTIISKSPNKPNIKFCVQKIDNTIDMSMVWLVDALEKLKIDFPRTIIYSNTIKQLSELYSYLCTENPDAVHLIDMFHSETPEEKKKTIISKLKDGNSELRIILATFALGMGIDICNFNSCILYGAPSSVIDLIPEVGRIERNGDEAVALLLFNKYHLQQMESNVKRIYKTQTCVRLSLMEDFLTKTELAMVHSGTHTCCDICEKECTCGQCNKVMIEQFFYGIVDNEETSSSSSDTVILLW